MSYMYVHLVFSQWVYFTNLWNGQKEQKFQNIFEHDIILFDKSFPNYNALDIYWKKAKMTKSYNFKENNRNKIFCFSI